jgi:hypothetical protein
VYRSCRPIADPTALLRQDSQPDNLEINIETEVLDDAEAEKILPYEAGDSPFPEVRAVVRPVDDTEMVVNTVRMWTIGILFTIVYAPFLASQNLISESLTLSFSSANVDIIDWEWFKPIL